MCDDDEQKPAFPPIDLSRDFRTTLQSDLAGMNDFNGGNSVVIQPTNTHVMPRQQQVGLKRLAND